MNALGILVRIDGTESVYGNVRPDHSTLTIGDLSLHIPATVDADTFLARIAAEASDLRDRLGA